MSPTKMPYNVFDQRKFFWATPNEEVRLENNHNSRLELKNDDEIPKKLGKVYVLYNKRKLSKLAIL